MYRIVTACVALASLLIILPIPAHSAPTITEDWAFIDNRPTDDLLLYPGLRLNLSVRATDPGGVPALTDPGSGATVVSSNSGFPFITPRTVPLNTVFPIIGGAEFTTLPTLTGIGQFPLVTGTYTYTVTNTSVQSAVSTSHNLDKPEVIPFPSNLAFSDQSTIPVFTFVDPDPTPNITGLVRRYQIEIFDDSKTNILRSDVLLATSFAVPSGILEAGKDYYFRADSWDFDITETAETTHSRTENRALAYATFHTAQTAVPEPATMLLFGLGLVGIAGVRRFKK